MGEQLGFDLEDREIPPGYEYPLLVASRLLSMMAAEAVVHLEELVAEARSTGADASIVLLAEKAIRKLTSEPSRDFVMASTVRPRAHRISRDCTYG